MQPFCDRVTIQNARQQDRLLRFAAAVRAQLDASQQDVALISRTGIDLEQLGIRFSHSGIVVRGAGNAGNAGDPLDPLDPRWTVRQLYYACAEGRPRLYEQGVAGFLFNTDEPTLGHVSIVFPPAPEAGRLRAAVLDTDRALRLLAARYSANAYPFSVQYQNCNQWVAELLATAWGDLADGPQLRARAQHWLAANGYAPPPVLMPSHAHKFAASFSPMVQLDDHPADERVSLAFRTSLPAAIEAFVRERLPATRRIELCHDSTRIVVRHGWRPIARGCVPEPGDRVLPLD